MLNHGKSQTVNYMTRTDKDYYCRILSETLTDDAIFCARMCGNCQHVDSKGYCYYECGYYDEICPRFHKMEKVDMLISDMVDKLLTTI